MATQTSAVTADELLRMPNDGARYERAGRGDPNGTGGTEARPDRDTVRAPDVALVAS